MSIRKLDHVSAGLPTTATTSSEPTPTAASSATPVLAAVTPPPAGTKELLGIAPPARGRLSLAEPRAVEAIAKCTAHLETLGIPGASVAAATVDVDDLGMTHVRFDRRAGDAKVFGEQLIVHVANGDVTSITGRAEASPVPGGGVVKQSAIDRMQARTLALASFGKPAGKVLATERVVFAGPDGVWRQGYRVQVERLSLPNPRRMSYLVDGSTRSVSKAWNEIGGVWQPGHKRSSGGERIDQRDAPAPTASPRPAKKKPTTPPAANDTTLYSGVVDLKTTKTGSSYVLLDSSRGKGVHTMDARNKSQATSPVEITDTNDAWGEKTDSPRERGAIDAQFGMATTYDMYKELLGLDSFDLKGARMTGYVHIGNKYVNAFWNGSSMNYGDGDGTTSGPLTTLDITAHEITHGLTENTAGLVYSDESGGINEAMSDIGGFLAEYWAAKKNPTLKWDWAVGEDCWTPTDSDPTDALRYMDRPTKDGYSIDHYSKYPTQTEVHGSSGVANNAFYQLAETRNQGKVPNSISGIAVQDGIGPEKAGRIFFRALQYYMPSGCTFAQARAACIKAATDLFGAASVEVQKTREAWSAVGVEDPKVI